MTHTTSLPDHYWAKVDQTGECWNWTAMRDHKGYGRFSVNRVPRPAHRVSYEDAFGPIPAGYQIDHVCFNKACVRPSHLRAVTHGQNQWHQERAYRNNGTGYLGVSIDPRDGTFRARIRVHGKAIHIGTFRDPAEAHAAYLAKKAEVHQLPPSPSR